MILAVALGFGGVVYFNKHNQKSETKKIKVGFKRTLVEIQGEASAIEPHLENITIKTGTPPIFRSYTITPELIASSGVKLGDIVKIKTIYREIRVKKIEVIRSKQKAAPKPGNKGAKKDVKPAAKKEPQPDNKAAKKDTKKEPQPDNKAEKKDIKKEPQLDDKAAKKEPPREEAKNIAWL